MIDLAVNAKKDFRLFHGSESRRGLRTRVASSSLVNLGVKPAFSKRSSKNEIPSPTPNCPQPLFGFGVGTESRLGYKNLGRVFGFDAKDQMR
jgi:hypothetical protein